MAASDKVRARVVVTGRVQGVFYRAETRARARTRKLGGWVRNRPDGSVEAVFEGPRTEVESMIAWCREGPQFAQVDDVTISWERPIGQIEFGVR
ncbi:MAG: acylphosphatase [Actinomycetota bacterium]